MAGLEHGAALLPVSGAPWRGVRYGCTTRRGGVSVGVWASFNLGMHTGDDPQAVRENRRRLAAALPAEPFWLEQVHGTQVADADAPQWHAGTSLPRADAAITSETGRVLAIMTADCVPVVMADIEGRVLGVAHAGWRGLAGGVLEATLAAMQQRLPAAVAWRAWVGPCIGQARFEVGEEVRQAFVDFHPDADKFFLPGRYAGKWMADLPALACQRLEMAGVYGAELSGLCTYDRDDLFYSYRRSAGTGRMATLAWLVPPGQS